MVLLLVAMVLYQLIQESSFLTPIPLGNKYKKSTLSPEIKATILDRIEEVLVKQQFYKRDDASLTSLADELGVTTHHLSQVLNESLMISFQDLIARYRVREACRLLRDESHAQVKIENVANLVGYNSKSAFNTAFKKRTGLTPSEYREAKDVRSYGEERLSERKEPSNDGSSFSLNHVFNFKIPRDMIQHFFKIFTRNVKRNGLFSFLNLMGLTVGFTCSILIYLYIADEQSYDRNITDYNRIHRIAWISENPQTRTPHPMAQAMAQDFPEVESAVSLSPWYGNGLSKTLVRVRNVATNSIIEEPDFYFADSTFLEVFGLKVLEGDKEALKKPFSLVISKSMANRHFGDESAIGKELEINDMPIEVSAVVESMPKNAHFHFNAILPYVTLKQINPTDSWMKWEDFGHFNYLKLSPLAKAEEVEAKIPDWVSAYLEWDQSNIQQLISGEVKFALQPIADIHLHSHLRWELENNGNIQYIYILGITLIFLMLIACINYVNLTTSKSIERAKEIGVRKTLGAVSRGISVQFYLETVLFCVMAMLLSIVLSFLLLESFNFLSGKSLAVGQLFNMKFIGLVLLTALVIGFIAGFYPALVLSSFMPTEVLKRRLKSGSEGIRLRSALVVFQFTISAVLIAGSLMIFRQVKYMRDADLGFDKEGIIAIDIPASIEVGGIDITKVRAVQQQIEGVSGVISTTMMSNIPGGQFNQHPFYLKKYPDRSVDMIEFMVDYKVEETLGLELVAGRSFDPSHPSDSVNGIIINEIAARSLNLVNPVGEVIVFNGAGQSYETRIVGVVKDFHYQSLHQAIQPMGYTLQPLGVSNLLVKVEGNKFGTVISRIEKEFAILNKDLPFEYRFLDEQMGKLYDDEIRSLNIFGVFACIALALACLGLLGMALATINQRIKEVGMRKILGATNGQIMWMIIGQFLRLVGIALLIGLPIAHLLMQFWMQEFTYQVAFGFMPFIWAILILLTVAMVSVISAVSKITYSNPVEALRYE